MKVTTVTTVTVVLTGKEATALAVDLNLADDNRTLSRESKDLLYLLREIPDDGEEVLPS